MDGDADYLKRRAAEERAAAANAAHPAATQAHEELAARYEDMARAIEARADQPGLRLVEGRAD